MKSFLTIMLITNFRWKNTVTGSVRGFCPLPKFDLHPLYFFLLRNSRTSRRIWRTHDGEPDPTLLDIFGGFINLAIMKKKFLDRSKHNSKTIFLVLVIPNCETLVYNGAAMRPDVNSCVNSIRIFATSNNYMWTTGNLLKERNFPQASLLSHLPKQIKFFPNEFKFPGSLRKTCLSVIGWGDSVITTYKKKIKRKLNLSTNMEAWWYNSLI